MKKQKAKTIIYLLLFGVFLGACVGFATWAFLRILSLGMEGLWTGLPKLLGIGAGIGRVIFTLVITVTGGAALGIFQKKYGTYPEPLEVVLEKVKKEGKYYERNVFVLFSAAFIPLLFGASLGPEAGFSSVIVASVTFIGMRIKYKSEEIRELATAGVATTIGVVFNAPFYGIVKEVEEDLHKKEDRRRFFSEKTRKIIKYILIILSSGAGLLVINLLSYLFGTGFGIKRFTLIDHVTMDDWKWFAPFLLIGILGGVVYQFSHILFLKVAEKMPKNPVYSTVVGGIGLGTMGGLFPATMFSGEHEMGALMEGWTGLTVGILIALAVAKILLTTLCLNFGWKGGNIFPIIFSGCSLGYALVTISEINPVFGVGVAVAGTCGYIMKKPGAVVAILFLCFPLRMIFPLLFAAVLAVALGRLVEIKMKKA